MLSRQSVSEQGPALLRLAVGQHQCNEGLLSVVVIKELTYVLGQWDFNYLSDLKI